MASKRDPHATQLKQLRATVQDLRAKLAKEARERKVQERLVQESKKARAKVAQEATTLRARGQALARQLKQALGNAEEKIKAHAEGLSLAASLRKELARKTDELKRKSAELVKLAKESAERARSIIREEPVRQESPPSQPEGHTEAPVMHEPPKPPES
jgi:uncharacterized phage infection (PIP) family protein YhgE